MEIETLYQIFRKVDFEIPISYIDFITTRKKDSSEILLPKNLGSFNTYSLKELLEKTNIDNHEVYKCQILKGYAQTLREIFGENTFDNKGNPFSLSKLEKVIAIGYENTRILFIDEDEKVYIFHPDGGDIYITDLKFNEIV